MIGYARVANLVQKLDAQEDLLQAVGYEKNSNL